MPTVTVRLDKAQAARLARWARHGSVTRSAVIRALIDRCGPIDTGDDLEQWVEEAKGRGLGLAMHRIDRDRGR